MEPVERPDTPAESLQESLAEMTKIRKGELPKRTWKQFKQELHQEDSKED